MKKFVITILVVFCASTSDAQTGTTYDCPYLQQYEGEWVYANGGDTIRVYLRKGRTHDTETNEISDRLFGWHQYKHNNVIVESNYDSRFETIPYNLGVSSGMHNSMSFYIINGCTDNLYEFEGYMKDLTLGSHWLNGVKAIVDPSRTVLTWKMWPLFRLLNTDPQYMTLPTDFILIRE